MKLKYMVEVKCRSDVSTNWYKWMSCTKYMSLKDCEKWVKESGRHYEYRIIRRIMDEKTFTVRDKVVKVYCSIDSNYFLNLQHRIVYNRLKAIELEKCKRRCKTAKNIADKDVKIAECKDHEQYYREIAYKGLHPDCIDSII